MEYLFPKNKKIAVLGMDEKGQPEVRWETKLGQFSAFADLKEGGYGYDDLKEGSIADDHFLDKKFEMWDIKEEQKCKTSYQDTLRCARGLIWLIDSDTIQKYTQCKYAF